MTIKEKLLKILEDKGISEYKFYKETGVSRGTLSNNSGLNADTLAKFFAYFPDIDANLVFKAKKFDYIERNEHVNTVKEPESNINTLNIDYFKEYFLQKIRLLKSRIEK